MRNGIPLLMILLFLAVGVRAGEVVIVRTSDAEPYVQAEEAAQAVLTAQGHQVRRVTAKEASEKGIGIALGKPGLVIAMGTPAAVWLHKQLPPETPLSYCMVTNAQAAGLTQGRQATGITTDVPAATQFNLIREALPQVRSVGMLYRSDTADGQRLIKMARESLPAGWAVEAVAINEQNSMATSIEVLLKRNVEVIWTTPDQSIYDGACVRMLLLGAMRSKVPVWGFSSAFVRAGALMGVAVEPRSQGTQAGELALTLLAQPAAAKERSVPPRHFQIAINLIVAEQLDVTVPEGIVHRAAHVFKAEK